MKHDEDAVTNNRFFDERGSKKNSPGCRRIKNLRRKNGLHYFKQTRLYVPAGELRKRLFIEFHGISLAGHKGISRYDGRTPKTVFLAVHGNGYR